MLLNKDFAMQTWQVLSRRSSELWNFNVLCVARWYVPPTTPSWRYILNMQNIYSCFILALYNYIGPYICIFLTCAVHAVLIDQCPSRQMILLLPFDFFLHEMLFLFEIFFMNQWKITIFVIQNNIVYYFVFITRCCTLANTKVI